MKGTTRTTSDSAKHASRLVRSAAKKLRSTFSGKTPPAWSEVSANGRAFACAVWLECRKLPACFLCADPRSQELLAEELETWSPGGVLFPALAPLSDGDVLPDPETLARRLAIAERIASDSPPPWIVLCASQLEESVPRPESLRSAGRELLPENDLDLEEITALLESWQYERAPKVFERGQFSVRGGILDIFSWQHRLPIRLELFGSTIDSLREFDPDRQISLRKLEQSTILPRETDTETIPLAEFLASFEFVRMDADSEIIETPAILDALDPEIPSPLPILECEGVSFSAGDLVLDQVRRETFFSRLAGWLQDGWETVFFIDNEGEWERFRELALSHQVDVDSLLPIQGAQTRSFLCPDLRLVVLTDTELFGRAAARRAKSLSLGRDRLQAARTVEDFTEFEEGDYVVDIDHGIGIFRGLRKIGEDAEESLCVEYANEAKNYVPISHAWKITRYAGMGKSRPSLSELGSGAWTKAKGKARAAVFAYARRMLDIQAERENSRGFAFPPDSTWQHEFEDSFLFEETPDQLRAIQQVKADMESLRPMDRLICGDVGFGKTEVAIRAAFKAVMGGKQVAFLAPTTVLAKQHHDTLRERMSDYPIRIELLNRYRAKSEQTETVKRLASGEVDIVVGTHRILSPDVAWKDLGLLVVDEEQRFGVRHKEILKERFRLVDVLTLSATPIPRTLYLSLMGARDMSVIETPPPNRQPVETLICGYDERILRDAIQRELARGGQVFLLHNRTATIDKLASRVRHLVPGVRAEVGHGQMPDGELEQVMQRFVEGKTDVLVSTTIIESGLDIPNANTILIDRADLFGLADLYQLRGRVGRSGAKAYAFLFLPRSLLSVGESRKRLSAMKQYTQLGSGFKIAMRDLEIRGAGNILGTAQSGQITSVGFDLYCKLLRSAVAKVKNEPDLAPAPGCPLRLDFVADSEAAWLRSSDTLAPAFLPHSYIADNGLRMEAYRKVHEAPSPDALEQLVAEWKDRFGPVPEAAHNLLLCTRIQLAAARAKFSEIRVRDHKLMLTRRGDFLLLGGKFPRLRSANRNSRLREVLDIVKSLSS